MILEVSTPQCAGLCVVSDMHGANMESGPDAERGANGKVSVHKESQVCRKGTTRTTYQVAKDGVWRANALLTDSFA